MKNGNSLSFTQKYKLLHTDQGWVSYISINFFGKGGKESAEKNIFNLNIFDTKKIWMEIESFSAMKE